MAMLVDAIEKFQVALKKALKEKINPIGASA